jgi:hypothetical protein
MPLTFTTPQVTSLTANGAVLRNLLIGPLADGSETLSLLYW